MDVGSILADKGSRVLTIRPDAPLLLAAQHMRAMGVGALVVSSDGDHVDGLLSERDVVVAFAEHPELLAHRKVSEVMLRSPVVARPHEDLDTVTRAMTRRRQRQVPVLDREGHLVGVVSVGDMLKHQLEEASLEVRVLRDVAITRS